MTDQARGFPAFPPGRRGARRVARSWWGRAWVAAVEDTLFDADLLAAGRRYANAGYAGPLTISPGLITATVHEGDPDLSAAVRVAVPRWHAWQWDRFLDEVTGHAGSLAAMLARELPQELALAATDAQVPLLPELGDLRVDCTCPEGDYGCVHAAVVCYQAGWLLDTDPWLLLLLRGRPEPQLLGAVRQRHLVVARAARRAQELLVAAGLGPAATRR